MSNLYKVSINLDSTYGYITYDEQSKEICVELADANAKQAIISYLSQPHLINEPKFPSPCDFAAREYLASTSKEDLQMVLSRMYNHIQIHVNWSIPTEIDMNAI